MCVVIVKPKGVEKPSNTILERCHDRNSDGAGVAVRRGRQIIVAKGYFKIGQFLSKLKEIDITQDEEVIYHFRIATSGKVDWGCSHPFPITTDIDEMKKDECIQNFVVAHNGVISQYSGNKKVSDTMLFIQDVLARPEIANHVYESEGIKSLISGYIGSDKLAFLHNHKGILTLGDFQEHKDCLYSNDSYKKNRCYYYSTKNENIAKDFNGFGTVLCESCLHDDTDTKYHPYYDGNLCPDCTLYYDDEEQRDNKRRADNVLTKK